MRIELVVHVYIVYKGYRKKATEKIARLEKLVQEQQEELRKLRESRMAQELALAKSLDDARIDFALVSNAKKNTC